ncbi:hypothetical protein BDA96_06G005400 [Sorghum bicolor]|uniref:Uncharacterized protein n=1 Tax=Sorghum bicolor TaxID=4558 RepID=A0A921QQ77_SORBI|nr:hypothetical protein BDA96_06G005400 [Sorghum bicolor]
MAHVHAVASLVLPTSLSWISHKGSRGRSILMHDDDHAQLASVAATSNNSIITTTTSRRWNVRLMAACFVQNGLMMNTLNSTSAAHQQQMLGSFSSVGEQVNKLPFSFFCCPYPALVRQ